MIGYCAVVHTEVGQKKMHFLSGKKSLYCTNWAHILESLLDRRELSAPVQVGQEQRVDQGGLAEAALAHNHERELEAALHRLAVNLEEQMVRADDGEISTRSLYASSFPAMTSSLSIELVSNEVDNFCSPHSS